MWIGPPKALDWPKPMSSISTMSTFGAPAGALTSNRGGALALRASSTVLCGYFGSGIGRTVRSVGSTTPTEAGLWAAAGVVSSGTSIKPRLRTSVINVQHNSVLLPSHVRHYSEVRV